MRLINPTPICLAIVLGLSNWPTISLAGGEAVMPTSPFFTPTPPPARRPAVPDSGAATNAQTEEIVARIQSAKLFCFRIPQREYWIDCLSERLDAVARSMPDQGDYAEARETIEDASQQLAALARQSASRSLPRARVRSSAPGGPATTRPLVPVRTEALDDVGDAAAAILEEAETVLLRSAESSEQRRLHYERIAAAVGSEKVLLRSL